jgi:Rieske 2Fe-2S family protein
LHGVGSYVEFLIMNRSILVVRESADSIRAYHNACRHRGTRLATGRGRVGSIICPFHGWRWNLDGSIRLVLDEEEFPDRSDDDLGLQPVLCDTWGGFVFVNMDLGAEPLLEYLDPIPEVLDPFGWEKMRYRWMKGVKVPTNWKTVLDGFLESYHVPGTHPQLLRYDRSNHNIATPKELESRSWGPTEVFGKFAKYSTVGRKQTAKSNEQRAKKDPTARSTRGAPDMRASFAANVEYIAADMRALENERSLRAAEQLRDSEVPEGMNVGQYYVQLLREISIADGLDWRDITPEEWAAAGTAWLVFPNTILLPNQGCVVGYRARPISDDPDECLFEAFSLEQVPVDEYDTKREFEPQYFDDYRDADVGSILTQDLDNCENITVGMHSPSFEGHYLSGEQEMTVYNAHVAADRYLFSD